MKIESVEVFVFKYDHHYLLTGRRHTPNRIPGTNYYFEPQWRHAYSRLLESCIVKITTDTGLVGWGESQAPLVPEVPATLIANLIGPATLEQNPSDPELIYDRLYHLNHVRGHTTSFTIDAIAGIDMALWDIKSKAEERPLNQLLGKVITDRLPLYVSGLRKLKLPERKALAEAKVNEGFKGVKIFFGGSAEKTIEECEAIRSAVGPDAMLAFDAICCQDYKSASRIGHGLDRLNASWFESPLDPGDILNHLRLSEVINTPVAIGEALRTVGEFAPWIDQGAMQIAQPDIARCGITGARHIIGLARKNKLKIAPHLGVCTAIGIAATWHVSSTLSDIIQEHQLDMFETANKVLQEPLQVEEGKGILPHGKGLGIKVNQDFIEANSSEKWVINSKGIVHHLFQRKSLI